MPTPPIEVDDTLKERSSHGSFELPIETYTDNCEIFHSLYNHWHDEMELIYIESGSGLVRLNKEILRVKAGDLTHDVAAFRAACEHLLARGAEVLILGCTELPPAFELYRLDYPNVDPTLELALGAIRAAGCETK